MMTKTTLLGKTQFGHPVKVIKRDQRLWKDSRGVTFTRYHIQVILFKTFFNNTNYRQLNLPFQVQCMNIEKCNPSKKAHLRAILKPRYFHGGPFATGNTLPSSPFVVFRQRKQGRRQKGDKDSR